MRHFRCLITAVAVLCAADLHADIGLFEYGFNLDGTVSNITLGDPLPAGVNDSAFNAATGLGSISYSVNTPGSHYFGLFVDHEIDELINTFFNEYGVVTGAATSAGPFATLTWEIDEPGYVFGDIYSNFTSGNLDNSNGVPDTAPDDVSMALAWGFTLGPMESASIVMHVSPTAPAGGFYLAQRDPDSDASIYFSSSLTVRGDASVPDGGSTAGLLFGVLGGLAGLRLIGRRT